MADKRILFVCTGNICRSPTADGVMRHLLQQEKRWLDGRCDSAALYAGHEGCAPDPRTIAAATRRGFDLSPLRARVFQQDDYHDFDLILAMDRGHLAQLQAGKPADSHAEIHLFLDFLPGHEGQDVPDPYYGQGADFEKVLDLVIPTVKILIN